MVVTIDSNVLYQALHSNRGASHAILRLVRGGELKLALSVPVFGEYQDLLGGPDVQQRIKRTPEQIETVLQFIAFV